MGIMICMRTTINIDDELLAKARSYTGENEKTKLVRLGLEALIQREVAKRLVALGGSMPDLEVPQRRRSSDKRR
jgi:Arc/MetJ family transcription regulator